MMTIVLSSVLSAVVCLGIYILVTKYVTKKTIRHCVKPPGKRRKRKAK